MNIIVSPNLNKKDAYSCAVAVIRKLKELGADVFMDSSLKNSFSNEEVSFCSFDDMVNKCDIVAAIGGDGTILKCASKMIESNAELLGINTGTLGFMASMEKDELNNLERLFTKNYKISERMLLKAEIKSDDGKLHSYHALNDIVVTGMYAKIVDFDVLVNDHLIGSYRADGAIFATPTGSTAYSLSAGGPVIEPELECMEMNLICPHSLYSRPMIYTDDKVITVVHHSPEESNVYFSVDGNEPKKLYKGEKLIIKKSQYKIKLIDMSGVSFYDALNQKLSRSLK